MNHRLNIYYHIKYIKFERKYLNFNENEEKKAIMTTCITRQSGNIFCYHGIHNVAYKINVLPY